MLSRGTAARFATSVFHQNYNDFDIYVEDTALGYEKIFANLLSRASRDAITIDRVYPLGARSIVIAEAKKTQPNADRKSIFIIDGDLYLLHGETEDLPKNVVTLPRYCIENFLFDEESLISIADEECTNLTKSQIKDLISYNEWIQKSTPPLRDLFITFAACSALKSSIPTIKNGYSSICANSDGDICTTKTRELTERITTQLNELFGNDLVEKTKAQIHQKIDKDTCFISKYVSAKDFSLPLIIIKWRKICGSKSPNINLKIRLSKISNPLPLRGVVDSIKDIAG